MPDEEARALERELRQAQEKLAEERNSAVHLRIAAVEAQARADRDAQAVVNRQLRDDVEGVKGAVDDLKTSTHKGFSENRIGMVVLMIGVALTLIANLPGLWAVLKGHVP